MAVGGRICMGRKRLEERRFVEQGKERTVLVQDQRRVVPSPHKRGGEGELSRRRGNGYHVETKITPGGGVAPISESDVGGERG